METKQQQKLDSKVENWLAIIKGFYELERKVDDYKREEQILRLFLTKLEEEQKSSGKLALCTLEEPIAKGGHGIVFRATHNHIPGQQLALKFNRPVFEQDLKIGVQTEIEVIPKLDHPNIVKLIDAGQFEIKSGQLLDPQLYYIVEPYIANTKLSNLLTT